MHKDGDIDRTVSLMTIAAGNLVFPKPYDVGMDHSDN